jgi:bifunctional DNA-binding transcriptional regulator/antitoxin component of YhaV-PrlF toxin-antitoxin module
MVSVTKKYQVTIPKQIREDLGKAKMPAYNFQHH